MRLDDHAGDGLVSTRARGIHCDQRARQDARIHPADLGEAQEAVRNAGDHQADGIHVCGDHHGWARACAGALPQSMQGAKFAAADLVDERRPFGGDDFGDGILVAGETGGSEQFFEEGGYIIHWKFGEMQIVLRYRGASGGRWGGGIGKSGSRRVRWSIRKGQCRRWESRLG